jgi:hypothetical protein
MLDARVIGKAVVSLGVLICVLAGGPVLSGKALADDGPQFATASTQDLSRPDPGPVSRLARQKGVGAPVPDPATQPGIAAAAQDLEHHFVQAAAEVCHPSREWILDQRSRLHVRWQPDVRGLANSLPWRIVR